MDVHPPKNGINRYWSIPKWVLSWVLTHQVFPLNSKTLQNPCFPTAARGRPFGRTADGEGTTAWNSLEFPDPNSWVDPILDLGFWGLIIARIEETQRGKGWKKQNISCVMFFCHLSFGLSFFVISPDLQKAKQHITSGLIRMFAPSNFDINLESWLSPLLRCCYPFPPASFLFYLETTIA
jgi:hypothetical protein